MNIQRVSTWRLVTALAALITSSGAIPAFADPPAQDFQAGTEVLAYGPIHEAFAAPVALTPQAGPIIARQPPDAINELPPEAQLDDPSAEWISGYWSWDDERADYLWVSGIWRVPPPERRWIPGYWAQVEGGFQRLAGFWSPAAVQEVNYLPYPAASLDAGPNVPAPSPDYFWVPGSWVFQEAGYQWRAGYWTPIVPNWIWVAASYVWTPRGGVFVDGYWDYPLADRGLLFAPVYFSQPVYTQPNYVYSPFAYINTLALGQNIFARPQSGSYYFGDYYGASYLQQGYYPWYSLNNRSYAYDPLNTYQSWANGRGNPIWRQQAQQRYDHLAQHQEARPPRTMAAQRRLGTLPGGAAGRNQAAEMPLVASLKEAVADNRSPLKLRPLADEQRQQLKQHAQLSHRLAQQRGELEVGDGRRAARTGANPGEAANPSGRLRLPEIVSVQKPALPRTDARGAPAVADTLPPSTTRPAAPAVVPPEVGPGSQPPLPRGGAQTAKPSDRPLLAPGQLPAGKTGATDLPRPSATNKLPPDAGPLPSTAPPRGNPLAVQPQIERPITQPQPRGNPSQPQTPPTAQRPMPQPQPQVPPPPQTPPKVERPTTQPQPRGNPSQPQTPPAAQQPMPKPQPRVIPPQPQAPPKVERPAPKPQVIPAPAPQVPAVPPAAGPKPDKPDKKGKG